LSELIIGVDLGGTNVKTALLTSEGDILGKDSRPTKAEAGPEGVVNRIVQSVAASVDAAGASMGDVCVAGVGSPGPLNWQTGVVYYAPNLPGWEDVPLARLMSERLGVPAYVENDANAACFGEFWLGAGRDVESLVLLTLGTGVGGGIVTMGRLLRGPDGTAAEVGHMCVMRDGRPCNCGARGCLETYASVTGMVRTAVKGIQEGRPTILTDMCGEDLGCLTGKMISDAVDQGDAFAEWVIQETGVWLGVAIGSLLNLLNPERVVLAGGMIGAGDVLFRPVRETAAKQAFDEPAQRAAIVEAELAPDSGVIGAAGAAWERYCEERA
jgi:glucokinase